MKNPIKALAGQTVIYGLGTIVPRLLNYLLTGKLPNEELHQGALKPVIEQCIEIDESKRFQSADELKKVLLGKKPNSRRSFQPLPASLFPSSARPVPANPR